VICLARSQYAPDSEAELGGNTIVRFEVFTLTLNTPSLAGGYVDIDLKNFQDDLSLNEGYSGLVNLMM
jgi:hypothetical protein